MSETKLAGITTRRESAARISRGAVAYVLIDMADELRTRYLAVLDTFTQGMRDAPEAIEAPGLPLTPEIRGSLKRIATLRGQLEQVAHELRDIAQHFGPPVNPSARVRGRHVN